MHPSVTEFEARVRRGPQVVGDVFALPMPKGLFPWSETSLVFTGIGASEATARTAEQLLRHELRLRVSVQPLSDFLHRDIDLQGKTLVLLSQELSPNAVLALQRAESFQHALLLTSLPATDARLDTFRKAGGQVWTLPPAEERGLLVRVMGPLASTAALLKLAWAGNGAALPPECALVPQAMQHALDAGFATAAEWPLESTRPPLVSCGWYARALESILWTWMEAWWVEAPPCWELLEVAHGPWQQHAKQSGPWLALTRGDDAPELWKRFTSMLPPNQSLLRAPSTLSAPLCFFEHFAFVQGLLAGVLRRRDVDLTSWPGQGTDAPLYRFQG